MPADRAQAAGPSSSAPASSRGERSRDEICARIGEINTRLQQMGASDAYCLNYFHSGSGSCEEHYAGVCVNHRSCCPPLPNGLMCSRAYARQLQYLKKRIEIVNNERQILKQQWQEFKAQHEAVENMLADNEEGQTMAKERRACLQSQISHQVGELRKLQGERYRLLCSVRPVNAKQFHDEVTSCLMSKMDLMEELALKGLPRAG